MFVYGRRLGIYQPIVIGELLIVNGLMRGGGSLIILIWFEFFEFGVFDEIEQVFGPFPEGPANRIRSLRS